MVHIIAVIVGALLGATGRSGFSVLAGAALGWLLVQVVRQQSAIADLRATLQALLQRAPVAAPASLASESESAPDAAMPHASSAQAVPPEVAPLAPEASTVGSALFPHAADPVASSSLEQDVVMARAGPDTVPMDEPPAPAVAAAATVHARPPASPPPWEPLRQWLVGGNTIVKAGVAILFIGLAFLAKYAAEHTHVPPELRLAAIGAAGVVLLGVGWRLRLSRPGYAQVLQGGAVAVLYLTLFAAFRYYGVLPAGPAFAMMVVVAALAAALAVLQDARALAVVGALGGFATPLIVSTGSDNATALFAYYFVLDAGIAAVAWSRTWRSLNLVGFVATFLVGTAWGVLRYNPAHFAMSEAFLVAFFLLFVLIMLLPARRAIASRAQRSDAWVNSSLLFGLPTVVFALQYGLVRDTPFATALSALVLGGFYVLLATTMRRRPELGLTFEASLAVATIFLTLVIPFALDERSTAGAWTLEAAGLVWIGFRQQRGLTRGFGYLLFVLAGFSMLLGQQRHGMPTAILNAYLFNGLMAAAAAIAGACFVQRNRLLGRAPTGEQIAEPLLIGLATLWLVSTAGLEIGAFVPWPYQRAALLVAASAIAFAYVVLAARLRWPSIAWPAVLHAPLMFLIAAAWAVEVGNPLSGGGAWAWPIAFAVHALVLRSAAPRWPTPTAIGAHAVGFVTLALIGALAGQALTETWGDAASAWPWLGWLVVPAILLLLVARSNAASVWPLRASPTAYTMIGGGVLAVGLWFWTLVANVASDGTASPLPHLPFLNPLDIGIALALVAIVLWLRAVGRASGPPLGAVGVAAFVWLNAMLVRAFHHYAGVPYQVDAWLGSLAVQTGIALLWATTALVSMWLGARRRQRTSWVFGAALLAAVVLKLLLVDLSGTGTVTRIVSFIGVGLLMLVVGYVAPLPSKETRHVPA